jgi:hypothetical protein
MLFACKIIRKHIDERSKTLKLKAMKPKPSSNKFGGGLGFFYGSPPNAEPKLHTVFEKQPSLY